MRIGYYAHHHGSGHCRQADKLAALLPEPVRAQFTVFTSVSAADYSFSNISEAQVIRLAPEDERADDVIKGRAGHYWQPESLHYSPVGSRDIQARSYQLIKALHARQIDLMIIDVSVEIAMLCRTISMPYLYVRLTGVRDDTPHVEAFKGALAMLAPYPRALEAIDTPAWIPKKSLYLDFIGTAPSAELTRSEFLTLLNDLADDATPYREGAPIITVIKGYGGHQAIDARLPTLRELLPDAFIISLGPISDNMRHLVDIATQVKDVRPFIIHSDALFMACGLNSIAQVYYEQTPIIVQPDARPHDEQVATANALIAQGRALSWDDFCETVQNNNGQLPTPTAITQTAPDSDTSAAALMHSFGDYGDTKAWFHEWLLPKLELRPER
ncbi:MAG: hypothetical protein L0G63_05545 [Psychrobacter sp.]|uniref:hypothetical protein n=1 Tax=Psychrobacter sp. TaxID=56811 RepID=UPI0026491CDD|nr:hypothetical protein [Psychrobacter sp.]MDN5619938.1 hypothetical protein [Psychrobacter sp.]